MDKSEQEKQFLLLAQKHGVSVTKVKEMMLPSEGEAFVLNGFLYRVNTMNVGKMRFSAEFLGAWKPTAAVPQKKGILQKIFNKGEPK